MDYIELKKRYPKDPDYSTRTFELCMYRRVLEGTMYDIIPNPFFKSLGASLGSSRQPIPLSQRRPSVRYRLSKVVVDNSVSLLFGEGRFPVIDIDEEEATNDLINEICRSRHLDLTMIDCATKGSIGSAVLFVRIIKNKLFFSADYTEYYTPVFDPEDPDQLLTLTEKYKVTAAELKEMGYPEAEDEMTYWFMRIWDRTQEIYYVPWKVSDEAKNKDFKPSIDDSKTITHNLGFVPAIWIKNLPGSDGIDGLCTFKEGIDTNIELDYQMSQGGRGLKYSGEPLLMIKNASTTMSGSQELQPGDVLSVDENGDAKHVEISGDACRAVLEYCKAARDIILENIHGNRTTPEKTHNVQSGKAMEMMHMSLIWLASKLRVTYGECALVCLVKMIIKINQQTDLMLDETNILKGSLKMGKVTLKWPAWFPSTGADRQQDAVTVKTLKDASLMSVKTAITTISDEYDIIDIESEIVEIDKDLQKQQKLEMATTTRTIAA